jgi:prophage DNA circulation protein
MQTPIQQGVRLKVTHVREQVRKAELIQDLLVPVLLRQILREWLTAILQAVAPDRVIHSQNQLQITTRFTGRVQHITEVQVPELLPDHTVLRLQVHVVTKAVHQCVAAAVATVAAAAEITAAAEVAAEAAVVHTPEVPAVVHQEEVADVLQEVVHLHPVADNFRKHIKFRFN